MEMNRCEVTIRKVAAPVRGQYFYRLILFHYETNKYFNHVFFKYNYLKSFGKKVGLTRFCQARYLGSLGDHYYTELDTSMDWKKELDKWYKEENEKDKKRK